MNFKDSQNKIVKIDDILKSIENKNEYKIYIGTDSQLDRKEKKAVYATCIVLYTVGSGGKIFTSRHQAKIPSSLKERLANEVWRSLEVAMTLSSLNINITVHVDVNKSTKFKSGNYSEEMISMVTSQGFKCQIKPDSFAASTVADRFVKKEYR